MLPPPPFYVDQPYSDIDVINSSNMQRAGLHLRMRVGKYYHVKFKDGIIKRFKYLSRYSSIKFAEAGKETSNDFTMQDFKDLFIRFPYGNSYIDALGGASFFGIGGSGSWGWNGFCNICRVVITDTPQEDKEVP
jgi:hypothetical protein